MGIYAITGASSGIGAKTKELLIQQGHKVINIDLKDGDICDSVAVFSLLAEFPHALTPSTIAAISSITVNFFILCSFIHCLISFAFLNVFTHGKLSCRSVSNFQIHIDSELLPSGIPLYTCHSGYIPYGSDAL